MVLTNVKGEKSHMKATVKLSDIVDGMEMQHQEMHQYLHVPSGKIYPISDEEFQYAENEEPLDDIPDWQRESVEIADRILSTDDYLVLPDQFEIHEYAIMERFCLTLSDINISEDIYHSIKGSGAFRRFKDKIHHYGIQDDWYKFKEAAFYEIALDWCKTNEVPFIDDSPDK